MAVYINPRTSDKDIADILCSMASMDMDDGDAHRYTEDEADDVDEYDEYEKGDAEDEGESEEGESEEGESEEGESEEGESEEGESEEGESEEGDVYKKREPSDESDLESDVDDKYENYDAGEYSSQEGLNDDEMIIESTPEFYMNESLENRVQFLNAHLNDGGLWESSTGIIVNYMVFVKDAMLRKLVTYWNEEIEKMAERGVDGSATLGIVGDHITKSGKKIYAVWLIVAENIGGSRVNTVIRKTWIGEALLLQFLLVLCHTQIRNRQGEYVNGW